MATVAISDQILQKQDKDGQLRRACEKIIQLYTDKSHFVYELLQNAEDAGATKVRFEQYEDRLEVLHDGRPFSVENLLSLCDIGLSDKTNDLNQIGEFGVGFKSVFSICEIVKLYSHPSEHDKNRGYEQFAVEIRDFTHPVDIEDQEVEKGFTTKFVFPYSVGHSFSGYTDKKKLRNAVSDRLQNLGITTLLFMRNLRSVEYNIKTANVEATGQYSLDTKKVNNHCRFVSAIGETWYTDEKEKVSYLVFSQAVKGIDNCNRTIDIAFAAAPTKNGGFSFVPANSPYISVYFPTETESKLKFLVQGPYRTTPNRGSVPSDDQENIKLAEQTAKLLRDSLIELRDNGRLDYNLLNILPINENDFANASLFKCIFREVKDFMLKERAFLCKDGIYAARHNVKLARNSELPKIITDELLTELRNDKIAYYWLPTFLTETSKEYSNLYDYMVSELEIEVIRPDRLGDAFNSNPAFLPKRDDKWLVEFYDFCKTNIPAAFSKTSGGDMLTAEIVKTSAGKFVAPYRTTVGERRKIIYLPNVFLPTKSADNTDGINYVDEKIFNSCPDFFTDTLKLERPKEFDSFVQDYLRRYENDYSVADSQRVDDLKKLLKYQDDRVYHDDALKLLRKYTKLKCIEDSKTIYLNPNEETVFFSVNSDFQSVEEYYRNIVEFPYVDIDFYERNGISRNDLELLDVKDDVAVGLNVKSPSSEFRPQLSLDRINDVLLYISEHPDEPTSMAKSSFIFIFLLNHENMLSEEVISKEGHEDGPTDHSVIIEQLSRKTNSKWNGKWIYTANKELVSPDEIFRNELNTYLYGPIKRGSELYSMLGFKKSVDEQLADAREEYDQLEDSKKNQYLELALRERFGLSIDEFEAILDNEDMKDVLSQSDQKLYPGSFPSSRVKNWDSLRKHAAQELLSANPVKYEERTRSIRVSKSEATSREYLKDMYRMDSGKYACQMCHKETQNFEATQLFLDMEKEIDVMYLCLCPNCAARYTQKRRDNESSEEFRTKIKKIKDNEIMSQDPVKIPYNNGKLWFTQTHIAEIRELLLLESSQDTAEEKQGIEDGESLIENFKGSAQMQIDNKPYQYMNNKPYSSTTEKLKGNTKKSGLPQKSTDKTSKKTVYHTEMVNKSTHKTGTSSKTISNQDNNVLSPELIKKYKNYVGHKVRHRVYGIGTVKSCTDEKIYVDFESGMKKEFLLTKVIKDKAISRIY